MAIGLDDYIYCSPFLSVASLDHLLDRPNDDDGPFDIPDPRPGCEECIDRQHACDCLHGVVDALPTRQRIVIHALFFAGYTVTQTANLMKISAAAVVKLRKKALNHLFVSLSPRRDTLFA